MQSFDTFAWNAARRLDLTEPLRYAAQRFGELLDPNAHFAAAASFTMDPVVAAAEFLELARAHASSQGKNPSHNVMLDVVERTRAALVADQNVTDWFGRLTRAAVASLEHSIDWLAADQAQVGKKRWLMRETSVAGRGAIRDLWTATADPTTGYRPRLVQRICETCAEPTLQTRGWLRFDRELRFIAAVAVAEGRTDTRLARAIAIAIAKSRNSDHAIDRLRRVLESPKQEFIVAFGLYGVRGPKYLDRYALRDLRRQNRQWLPGQRLDADDALPAFCAQHDERHTVVASTDVEAYDFEHAQRLAWQRGERAADQYAAEHRAYRIRVTPPMLALRLANLEMSEQPNRSSSVRWAKPRTSRPEPRLEQSLRYAALATAEQAPVVQVLHSWIALETLARGNRAPNGPYQLLMHNLAPALAVHAVRQGLAATWHVASRAGRRGPHQDRWLELERWLGIQTRHRNLGDLNKWVDLLRHEVPEGTMIPMPLEPEASLDDAGALLLELLPTMAPFAREAILRWRWRLEVGNRLSNWCDELRGQARACLGRMYVMRNATVHTAVTEFAGAGQLAHAAKNVVDTVYEVMPPWLEQGKPTWAAFERLHRRADHLHRTWNNLPRPALLNAESLTRPNGDGLAR